MKRIALFVLLAAFVLGVASQAPAADLKVRGDWRVHANWTNNHDFIDKNFAGEVLEDDFNVYQRARVWFDFIANENLKAVLGIEIGDITWGTSRSNAAGIVGRGSGGQIGADGVNIETKHAYLDFNIPGTKVNLKVGIQPIILPNQLGSVILDDDVAAAVLSVPFTDFFSAAIGWGRATNNDNTSSTQGRMFDEYDVAFLLLPFKFQGFNFTPFFVLGWLGQNSGATWYGPLNKKETNPWWVGLTANVTALDPLVFMLDFNYGAIGDSSKTVAGVEYKGAWTGWFMDFAVDWKLGFMTPELFFFYGSGEDSKVNNGHERMPTISNNFAGTSFVFDGSQFGVNSTLTAASDNNGYVLPTGKWGIGLALKDITFLQKLTHTLRIAYVAGTNDKATAGIMYSIMNKDLSSKDSIIEVNFDNQYMLYDNLAAILEIGYANLSVSSDAWGQAVKDAIGTDAWKVALGFRYKF